MAQLWGGRFTKETDKLVYDFNASISFDRRFWEQDIRGSIAHVTMLAKQGILTEEEKEQIIKGLEGIREDVENGTLEITEEYGIREGELSFEITETAAGAGEDDGDGMMRLVRYLQKKGFQIAMDDYGIGSSTLKLLHEIHFDTLKLDRFFISRIGDPKAEIILASTIAMAKALELEVVAEGVENREQIRFLLKHGCCYAQGYYYSRPLTKEGYMMRRMEDAQLCAEDGTADREETV